MLFRSHSQFRMSCVSLLGSARMRRRRQAISGDRRGPRGALAPGGVQPVTPRDKGSAASPLHQASRPLSTVPVGFLWSRRNHHFTVPLEDRMAKTRTTSSNLTVKITPNDKGNPAGKLADAELHFGEGGLAGLKLIGFCAPRRR